MENSKNEENILQSSNKKPKIIKRKKKKNIKHCNICCKTFASCQSYKSHVKSFHNDLTQRKKRTKKRSQLIEFGSVFEYFKNMMPPEFQYKYDLYKCTICYKINDNRIKHNKHEKEHYKEFLVPTVNGNDVSSEPNSEPIPGTSGTQTSATSNGLSHESKLNTVIEEVEVLPNNGHKE